ncbi:hypothetical protein ACQEVZ_39375 [Dactylosporangium sp. CA-152071]|uniref:hypothetical protein n=1 Tax=Dactylosporangium sp. CA-152071 TaxID=3239933 RepID=UPI003D8F2676
MDWLNGIPVNCANQFARNLVYGSVPGDAKVVAGGSSTLPAVTDPRPSSARLVTSARDIGRRCEP